MKGQSSKSNNKNVYIFKIVSYFVLIVFAISIIFPFSIILFGSFKSVKELLFNPIGIPENFVLANYSKSIIEGDILKNFLNSLGLVVVSTFFTLTFGSFTAFAIAKLKLKFKRFQINNFLYMFFLTGFLVPVFIAITPIMIIVSELKLIGNILVVILIYIGVTQAFVIFILTGFFRQIPDEIIDAAKIDGCSNLGIYLRVVFPLSKSGLISVAIMIIIYIWNDLLLPLVFLQGTEFKTLTQGTYIFQSRYFLDWGGIFAYITLQAIPILVIYFSLQKYFTRGITAGAIKG